MELDVTVKKPFPGIICTEPNNSIRSCRHHQRVFLDGSFQLQTGNIITTFALETINQLTFSQPSTQYPYHVFSTL